VQVTACRKMLCIAIHGCVACWPQYVCCCNQYATVVDAESEELHTITSTHPVSERVSTHGAFSNAPAYVKEECVRDWHRRFQTCRPSLHTLYHPSQTLGQGRGAGTPLFNTLTMVGRCMLRGTECRYKYTSGMVHVQYLPDYQQ